MWRSNYFLPGGGQLHPGLCMSAACHLLPSEALSPRPPCLGVLKEQCRLLGRCNRCSTGIGGGRGTGRGLGQLAPLAARIIEELVGRLGKDEPTRKRDILKRAYCRTPSRGAAEAGLTHMPARSAGLASPQLLMSTSEMKGRHHGDRYIAACMGTKSNPWLRPAARRYAAPPGGRRMHRRSAVAKLGSCEAAPCRGNGGNDMYAANWLVHGSGGRRWVCKQAVAAVPAKPPPPASPARRSVCRLA